MPTKSRRKFLRRFSALLFAFLATSLSAEPLRLSLDDALHRALSEGATARLAATQAERARVNEREALGGLESDGAGGGGDRGVDRQGNS